MLTFFPEMLQEVIVTTKAGRKLRVLISELQGQYCLYGDYLEVAPVASVSRVDFPTVREADAKALFAKYLGNFVAHISKDGDVITAVENPCNAPMVSKVDQEDILAALSVAAPVTVN